MAEVQPPAGIVTPEPVPFIDLVPQYNSIATEINDAVAKVFAEQKFILGDEVTGLEAEIAHYCDSREAIACASGTDALILSLMALGIGAGDEVITTPFTFFATASSICRVGATPVFVDIDPVSYNLDIAQVEKAITKKTKAIMPVHLFGQVAEMEPLWRIAVREKLAIVEDACQAIGAEYRGRRAGVLGTVACFSFFPTKNLGGAGDGGIMTTDDHELAAKLKRLRVHGDLGGYRHVDLGMNSRLDALQAAVLRVKLRHLESWTFGRQVNAARYEVLCKQAELTDALDLPVTLPERRHVYNQYTVRVKNGQRDAVLASMKAQQIGAAVYYPIPLHVQECFKHLGYKAGDLPEAERAANEVLSLPIFAELGEERQHRVVAGLAKALGREFSAESLKLPATDKPGKASKPKKSAA